METMLVAHEAVVEAEAALLEEQVMPAADEALQVEPAPEQEAIAEVEEPEQGVQVVQDVEKAEEVADEVVEEVAVEVQHVEEAVQDEEVMEEVEIEVEPLPTPSWSLISVTPPDLHEVYHTSARPKSEPGRKRQPPQPASLSSSERLFPEWDGKPGHGHAYWEPGNAIGNHASFRTPRSMRPATVPAPIPMAPLTPSPMSLDKLRVPRSGTRPRGCAWLPTNVKDESPPSLTASPSLGPLRGSLRPLSAAGARSMAPLPLSCSAASFFTPPELGDPRSAATELSVNRIRPRTPHAEYDYSQVQASPSNRCYPEWDGKPGYQHACWEPGEAVRSQASFFTGADGSEYRNRRTSFASHPPSSSAHMPGALIGSSSEVNRSSINGAVPLSSWSFESASSSIPYSSSRGQRPPQLPSAMPASVRALKAMCPELDEAISARGGGLWPKPRSSPTARCPKVMRSASILPSHILQSEDAALDDVEIS